MDDRGQLDLRLLHQGVGLLQALGSAVEITPQQLPGGADLHAGREHLLLDRVVELARQPLALGQHAQLATLLQQPEALEHQLGLGADGDVAAGTAAASGRGWTARAPSAAPCSAHRRPAAG